MTDTDALITGWRRSPKRTEQIAGELAARVVTMHSWAELPSLGELAGDYDTSERTIGKAKALLARHGLLVLECRRYYVS